MTRTNQYRANMTRTHSYAIICTICGAHAPGAYAPRANMTRTHQNGAYAQRAYMPGAHQPTTNQNRAYISRANITRTHQNGAYTPGTYQQTRIHQNRAYVHRATTIRIAPRGGRMTGPISRPPRQLPPTRNNWQRPLGHSARPGPHPVRIRSQATPSCRAAGDARL